MNFKITKFKKTQIRMGETIAVLIIFFFLLVMGAVFYFNVQRSNLYSNQEEYYAQESIKVSQIVSYLPELQCSDENIITDNCYDIYKLSAANDYILNNSIYYFPFFRYSEITVKEVYPGNSQWVIYNFSNNNSAVIPTFTPISLYNPTTKRYSFGILYIGYFPNYQS